MQQQQQQQQQRAGLQMYLCSRSGLTFGQINALIANRTAQHCLTVNTVDTDRRLGDDFKHLSNSEVCVCERLSKGEQIECTHAHTPTERQRQLGN